MSKKQKSTETANPTVAFRLPPDVRDFFQAVADRERRKLGQVLRIVLEDHARAQMKKQKAA